MIHDILFAIWFLLPAALANAAPIPVARLPFLARFDAPIDGGRRFHGAPLLGSHKTWRGVIAGIVIATLALWAQQLAVAHYDWARFMAAEVDYAALPTLILGPLFAIGALGGDAVASFFKRRLRVRSGKSWVPFDQLDYIIGGVVVSLGFVVLTPLQYIWIFIVWFVMHVLFSYLGYLVGLKKDPI